MRHAAPPAALTISRQLYVAVRDRASPRGFSGTVRQTEFWHALAVLACGTEWPTTPFFRSTDEAAMDWNRIEGNWKQDETRKETDSWYQNQPLQ
jgi:hypothetical protein